MTRPATIGATGERSPHSLPPRIGDLTKAGQLFVNGDGWDPASPDVRHILARLCNYAHSAGWSFHDVATMCADPTYLISRALGSIPEVTIDKFWHRTKSRQANHSASVGQWANALIEGWPLNGHHGTPLRVAIALAAKAEMVGSMTFTASVREIAEIAGVGWVPKAERSSTSAAGTTTVRIALNELCSLGAIQKHVAFTAATFETIGHARVQYTLTPLNELRQLLHLDDNCKSRTHYFLSTAGAFCDRQSNGSTTYTYESLLHVTFEHRRAGGLGMNAGRVWHLLQQMTDGLGKSAIGKRLNLSAHTVRTNLELLHTAGLVEDSGDKQWVALSPDLDSIAEKLGIADRQARRAAEHAKQRKAQSTHLYDGYRRNASDASAALIPYEARYTALPRFDQDRSIDPYTGEILLSAPLAVTEQGEACDEPAVGDVGLADDVVTSPLCGRAYDDFDIEVAMLTAEYFLNNPNTKALV